MENISLHYKITVSDTKTGKTISVKKGKSKSFVLGFLQLCQCQLVGSAVAIKDILASINSYQQDVNNLTCAGGAGSLASGIVVGTGNTAPTNADFKLQTIITHGAGAGQLNYGNSSFTAAQVVGGNVDLVLTRTFQNTSGGTVTILEIGAYMRGLDTSLALHTVLGIRDLVSQAVNNGQTATISYTLRTTV